MRSKFYKITDHPDLIKDSHSKAILNVDPGAIQRHEQRLARVRKDQKVEQRINTLEEDIDQIKDLLHQILGKMNG